MFFTGKKKAVCVLEFDKNNLWTCVESKFRKEFSKQSPDQPAIQKWHEKFKEEGCLCSDMCRATKACILNSRKKFNKTFISLIFAFKFLLRKLKNNSFQQKSLFSYLQQLLKYKLSQSYVLR